MSDRGSSSLRLLPSDKNRHPCSCFPRGVARCASQQPRIPSGPSLSLKTHVFAQPFLFTSKVVVQLAYPALHRLVVTLSPVAHSLCAGNAVAKETNLDTHSLLHPRLANAIQSASPPGHLSTCLPSPVPLESASIPVINVPETLSREPVGI